MLFLTVIILNIRLYSSPPLKQISNSYPIANGAKK